ncbi:ABC transporter substrate-binding protein [Glycomyces harbinensis]|uniref:Multiple sugar transport system substrate-binding protein n=1 Tax=Glycomyces harbinensis TaxID=58114 RepID=A0A1G6R105_9ACTN|nr:ABC transporter substrate-binding protein [Glycomyces harbinensis]SDC97586.1 multiple sugar transport system substrate-binding protein [Glycomyces harbinensis]
MTRLRILTGVGATLALLAAGCSSGGDDGGPVELTFWHGYSEADGDVLEGIVDDFNASHDDITIDTELKTWDSIDDTLLTALSAGEGPGLVAMPAERLPVYAAKGAFASLDDFYADEASNTANLVPGAAAMEEVEGEKFGVPSGFVPLAVYYNTALFEAGGVSAFPQTWDEWVAASKQLTVDEDGDGTPEQYGVVLPDHATVANGLWPSLFYGNGGDIVDGEDAVIDSPENAETLEFWSDAIAADQISPTGVDGIGADELFSGGKAAMTVGGPWMASIAEENGIDYAIAPIPAGPAEQAASAIGVSMAVTVDTSSAEQAAAEEFLSFFLSEENSVKWSLGSGWPPLRTDVPAEAVAENPVVASLTEIAETGRPLLPGVVNSVDVLSAIDELTQKAVAGEDVDTLLGEAQAEIQAALDD